MLIGAAGMSASMAVLAGTVSTGVVVDGAPVLDDGPGIAAVVMLFVFNTFFAVGWLGMTWLYPAEVTGLRIRIRANALATISNWCFNFLIVMIGPPALANIGYRTYIIFAVINAFIVPVVYFFFPETAHRSLEEVSGHEMTQASFLSSLTLAFRSTSSLHLPRKGACLPSSRA